MKVISTEEKPGATPHNAENAELTNILSVRDTNAAIGYSTKYGANFDSKCAERKCLNKKVICRKVVCFRCLRCVSVRAVMVVSVLRSARLEPSSRTSNQIAYNSQRTGRSGDLKKRCQALLHAKHEPGDVSTAGKPRTSSVTQH